MSGSDSGEYEGTLDGFPTERSGQSIRARIPLEVLATRFAEEIRRGEQPSIADYIARFPMYEEEIQDLFPTVEAMERWKHDKETDVLRQQFPEQFSLKKLGSYRVVREVGRGGMGIVVEGRSERNNERVAIKLLPWKVSDVPRFRKRFEQEAKTVASLHHDNIVPIHEFGEEEGYCYFVMPFIRGVGLDWIIERLRDHEGVVYADEIVRLHGDETQDQDGQRGLSRRSWKRMTRLMIQAANALEYAHSRKVLHNDIKPANLLLDVDGHVWITDFGVASSFDESDDTAEDRLTGTLRFMAPERFRGRNETRSDIYSLGATMYELLTLKPAFANSDRGRLVESILEARFTKPSEIRSSIPKPLEAIVLKMVQRDPASRYASAGEVAEDLHRFLKGERTRAESRGLFGRWRR